MEKVVIYSRVSTTQQTTENQLSVLKEVCERFNYHIVDTYIDEGVSGSKGREHRKEFDRMCKDMVRGKFHRILVWDISRLGRSLTHLVEFLNEVHSIGVHLYIHQSGIDTSTPTGKMMFQMIGVFSEFEREMIRERVKVGLQRVKSQGKKLGRPKSLTEDVVWNVWKLKDEGLSNRKISSELNISHVSVGNVLKLDRPHV